MRITVTSVFVHDQDAALACYTGTLGFVKKTDVPLGGADRWLTVVAPDDPDGTELLLEPDGHPAVKPDRIVAWAFVLGLLLILVAISTADAATL
jgi:catechol 2,3-dioxygenase-like lactoylglutathione lyase family enzyme